MTLKVSVTDIERVKAFALRHSCLTEEMGDRDFIMTPHKLFIDKMDNPNSRLLTAWDDGVLSGTARMLFRKFDPYIEDEAYHWSWLATHFNTTIKQMLQRTFLFDRACVNPLYRRQGLYDQLLNFACDLAELNKAEYVISAFEQKNQNAFYWARKNGFAFYPEVLRSATVDWHLICRKVKR